LRSEKCCEYICERADVYPTTNPFKEFDGNSLEVCRAAYRIIELIEAVPKAPHDFDALDRLEAWDRERNELRL